MIVVLCFVTAAVSLIIVVRCLGSLRENRYPRTTAIEKPLTDTIAVLFFSLLFLLAIAAFKEALHS